MVKNIVLIGFMGTGKSVVGKRIARQLNMEFVSTDNVIEEREERPIAKIFEESGEPYFRNVEKEVIKEISALNNVVIAAGGGAVLNEKNILNLRKNGILICLNARPEVIYERTKAHRHRPLLNVDNPVEKIKGLLNSRAPFYKKADYQIDTSDKSVEEIVKMIAEIIKIN